MRSALCVLVDGDFHALLTAFGIGTVVVGDGSWEIGAGENAAPIVDCCAWCKRVVSEVSPNVEHDWVDLPVELPQLLVLGPGLPVGPVRVPGIGQNAFIGVPFV